MNVQYSNVYFSNLREEDLIDLFNLFNYVRYLLIQSLGQVLNLSLGAEASSYFIAV